MSPSSQENKENQSVVKSKITKKVSRSVGDLRDTTGRGSHNIFVVCVVVICPDTTSLHFWLSLVTALCAWKGLWLRRTLFPSDGGFNLINLQTNALVSQISIGTLVSLCVTSSNQRQISMRNSKKCDYLRNQNGRPSRHIKTEKDRKTQMKTKKTQT